MSALQTIRDKPIGERTGLEQLIIASKYVTVSDTYLAQAAEELAALRAQLAATAEDNKRLREALENGRVAIKETRHWLLQTSKGDLSQEVVETYLNMIERAALAKEV